HPRVGSLPAGHPDRGYRSDVTFRHQAHSSHGILLRAGTPLGAKPAGRTGWWIVVPPNDVHNYPHFPCRYAPPLCASGLVAVAHAVLGKQIARMGRVVFELAA